MSFTSSSAPTRAAPNAAREWVADPEQLRCVEHLMSRRDAGLAAEPGSGKSSMTLTAFSRLAAEGRAKRMLVVAPLRVCRHVWRQEGAKWEHLTHLRFVFLHGAKKEDALKKALADGTEVFLINPEGVRWLCNLYFGKQLPFDVVCIDELTRFKNARSDRSSALRPRIERAGFRWGLTGSLAPNGYMDLFGQQLMLDGGAALGRYITHYRDRYFQVGLDGFSYALLPGAAAKITGRIAPTWRRMSAEGLPLLVERQHVLEMEKAERAAYTRMRNDFIAALPGGVVEAGNKAAVYSKLAQMANGAVYQADRTVLPLHTVKIDALDSIVEELSGEPVLVGYEFQHDRRRLDEWHQKRFGRPLPYLGDGQSETKENETLRRWNAGDLPVLAAHPASAGHGINMQEGHAAHLVWFGISWDFELYDQFIRRIRRRGNQSQRIFMHLLVVRGTIDELKLIALGKKNMTQESLFSALKQVLADSGAEGQETRMVAKLTPRGAAQPAPQGNAEPTAGGAWGGQPTAGGAWGGQSPQGGHNQREAIQDVIQPHESVRNAFSAGAQAALDQVQRGDYGDTAALGQQVQQSTGGFAGQPNGGWGQGAPAPAQPDAAPKRTRTRKVAEPAQAEPDDAQIAANVRLEVVKVVVASDPNAELADVLDIAEELAAWVMTGERKN